MGREQEAAAAFRGIVVSPWGALIAAILLLAPVLHAVGLQGMERAPVDDPDADAAGLASSIDFPQLLLALVLVVMAASGALAPARRPLAALAGRVAGLAALIAAAWAIPAILVAAPLVGSAAIAPVVLRALVHVAEAAAVAAVVTLALRAGGRWAGLAGAAYLAFAFYLVPLLAHAVFVYARMGDPDALLLWQLRLGFLSPHGAADGLLRALFPAYSFPFDPLFREDYPFLFSPWPWTGALAAWVGVPAALAARADPGGPDETSPA